MHPQQRIAPRLAQAQLRRVSQRRLPAARPACPCTAAPLRAAGAPARSAASPVPNPQQPAQPAPACRERCSAPLGEGTSTAALAGLPALNLSCTVETAPQRRRLRVREEAQRAPGAPYVHPRSPRWTDSKVSGFGGSGCWQPRGARASPSLWGGQEEIPRFHALHLNHRCVIPLCSVQIPVPPQDLPCAGINLSTDRV